MSQIDKDRWDARFAAEPGLSRLSPAPLLAARSDLLPRRGRALDVACGAGRNALFLAQLGLAVTGVDISSAGARLAQEAARARGLSIDVIVADLESHELPANAFSVVTCVHYLERRIFPALERALVPGGVLYFETFTRGQLAIPDSHPRREEFLLGENELLRSFPNLHVLHYEEGVVTRADGSRAALACLFGTRLETRGGNL